VARQKGCRLLALGHDFDFTYLAHAPHAATSERTPTSLGTGLDYRERVDGCTWKLDNVGLAMLGRHQASNAAVALATLGQLRRDGWRIDEAVLRSGLARARCPARFEVLSCRPTIILDVAHNPASVAAMREAMHEQFPAAPRLLVFAASADKDVTQMLGQLLPDYDHVVLTRFLNNPRSADPAALEKRARRMIAQEGWSHVHLHVCPDPPSAWQLVRALASPQHVVCVAGSFFLAAEVRQLVEASCHAALGASSLLR
jgi:dihydrofolate synthase/folylpolyglutamate synthase